MNNQEKTKGQSYRFINDKEPVVAIASTGADEKIHVTKLLNKAKPQLCVATTSDETRTSSHPKMTETLKVPHSSQENGPEQESRVRGKVIFNMTANKDDRQRGSSLKQESPEDISSVIAGSVASDVSGLTDGEFFKTDDFSAPSLSSSSKNKVFRSVSRAPEPPMVSPGKLTDIQSETTETTTTGSSSRDVSSKFRKKRSVSFCEVQVRNYERILEVNPSVTSGPAVGIGWNYSADDDEIVSIESFEETRETSRRGSTEEFALSRETREDILRSWGYTQREIAWSVRTIVRSKNQRKQTIQNLHAASMEEFVEKATRKMKHVLLFPLHTRKKSKQPLYICPPQNIEQSVLRKPSFIQPSAA